MFGWGPPGWGLRRVGPVCSPGCRQMPPLFCHCQLCSGRKGPACCSPGFPLTARRQKGGRTELAAALAFTLFFKKSELVPQQCSASFCSWSSLKGSSLFVKGQCFDSRLSHIPFIAVVIPFLPPTPCRTTPPPTSLSLQNPSPGFISWISGIENCLPFSPPLQGKIFSWKGVPWGPGGVPPCPPPGPGAQHLQAGNTQTTVRPGPRGLERAAFPAVTTGGTTTTTGGWST